jgi:ribonuclease P/MRP protein subunit RPP1
MALTHTVFGAPKQSEDKAENAIPDSLFDMSSSRDQKKPRGAVSTNDAASSGDKTSNQQSPIKVLRRLHAVLENLSDVGHYVKRRNEADADSGSNKNSAKILQEYDLVSLAPRNDATFQSACSSANASDIITLDYTSGRGGVQLPFRIRPADVKAVIARKAVFEIPYAPAVLNRNQRKGLVQTW